MHINQVEIEDTFAEAFSMKVAKVIITAVNQKWALTAAQTATGFATSIIGCGCEAGIAAILPPEKTPDGRPGVLALFFSTSTKALEKQLLNRLGQCVMTSPSSACYNGMESEKKVKIGGKLRYFGDGFQSSKVIDGRRFWRIPVMDGEFVVEESFGVSKAVGGGNFFILGENQEKVLVAAETAVEAMQKIPGIIMPFPGGIVRSGSKIGSKYKGQAVSVNTSYCPSIQSRVGTVLPTGVNSVLEIVIDGVDENKVQRSMQVGIKAACLPGVLKITAGNYGGKLGKYHFHLHELLGAV
jgi:formylmethanofuran--tetrahydromethanopterin N-formyltransferase